MSSKYSLMEESSSQSSEQTHVTSIYNYAVTTQHQLHLSIKPGKSLKNFTTNGKKTRQAKKNPKKNPKTKPNPFWFHLNHVYALLQTIQSYEWILLTSQTLNQKANYYIIFMCTSD